MFDPANGGQIGWLLPFAIVAGSIAIWYWRRDPARRAFAVLFVGWVLLFGTVFSYAQGMYHSYYTASMAPGIAVLVGIGTVALVKAVRRDPWWLMAAAGLIGLTVLIQLQIEGRTPDFYGWLRPLVVIAALGGVALMVFLASRLKRPQRGRSAGSAVPGHEGERGGGARSGRHGSGVRRRFRNIGDGRLKVAGIAQRTETTPNFQTAPSTWSLPADERQSVANVAAGDGTASSAGRPLRPFGVRVRHSNEDCLMIL